MNKIYKKIRLIISRVIRTKKLNDLVHEDFNYLINGQGNENKAGHILKRIMLEYHVIEKGLTMPEMRYGFGEKMLLTLISDIKSYIDLYGIEEEQVKVAIQMVTEYSRVHEKAHFTLSEKVLKEIDSVLKYRDEDKICSQRSVTKEEFYSHIKEPFEVFADSRHSVRHFKGEIDIESLKKAVSLSQTAPSACNRQSTRVKIVTDKELIRKVFEIQHGNRGFGQLADKLLVLTVDLQYWDISTYWGGYVDGGIYAMNLLYSLYYHKIAACPLNANLSPDESRSIKTLLNLPDSESIFLFIAVGDVPETFKLTNSHRSDYNSIITII